MVVVRKGRKIIFVQFINCSKGNQPLSAVLKRSILGVKPTGPSYLQQPILETIYHLPKR